MFHYGWFIGRGWSAQAWNMPWSGTMAVDWMKPDLLIDLTKAMERVCFDYVMIEDGSFIPDAFQGSADWSLRNAYMVPKNDPMPVIPLLAAATKHVGIVGTLATSFYPPFLAARLGATLDHLTDGRVGFNLVTAHNDRSAQNFGLDQHYEHDLRYEMADEWMDVVGRLWESWEPGAIVADPERGMFVDPSKVHPIEHSGRFYKCRGPLNTAPGPQRKPVICQAGGSPAGRAFAAKHADTIIARARTVEACREYRDDVSRQMIQFGRDPKDCKVLYCCAITLGDTMEEAREKKRRQDAALQANLEPRMAYLSFVSGKDFSKFDLDAPLPELRTNTSRSATEAYTVASKAPTLRGIVTDPSSAGLDFVGTADSIAAEMEETMRAIGGDGYLFTELLTRKAIVDIADGLAPALKKRGLVQPSYPHATFRENLLAF